MFVHNFETYKTFLKWIAIAETFVTTISFRGIVLKGENEIVEKLKREASDLLNKGPAKWTEEMMKQKRYFITDTLDDFIGASKRRRIVYREFIS